MTKTIKVKACDLSGMALDWAVDAAETGDPMRVEYKKDGSGVWMLFDSALPRQDGPENYSSDWRLAGRIIEREKISIKPSLVADCWYASIQNGKSTLDTIGSRGHSPLLAAMRCYVAARLGDEIEVPAELVEGGGA